MAPDFKSIFDMGSERVVADLAIQVIENNPGSFKDVLDLCFLEKYPLSMRAARTIQLYCEKYPEAIDPYLEEAIEQTLRSQIAGVRHNFLKIFAMFTDVDKLNDPGPLLNTCFQWLSDASLTPAVRIHSMGVIYKLGLKEPGLLHELKATLELILEEAEPSLKNCGEKMMRKISRQSTEINPPPVPLPNIREGV
jgi:hypothetical protein